MFFSPNTHGCYAATSVPCYDSISRGFSGNMVALYTRYFISYNNYEPNDRVNVAREIRLFRSENYSDQHVARIIKG